MLRKSDPSQARSTAGSKPLRNYQRLAVSMAPEIKAHNSHFVFSVIPNSLSRAPSDKHWSAEEVRRIKRRCGGAGAGTFWMELNSYDLVGSGEPEYIQHEVPKAVNVSPNLLDKVRKQYLVGGAGLSFKCLIRNPYMLWVVHMTKWRTSRVDNGHLVELEVLSGNDDPRSIGSHVSSSSEQMLLIQKGNEEALTWISLTSGILNFSTQGHRLYQFSLRSLKTCSLVWFPKLKPVSDSESCGWLLIWIKGELCLLEAKIFNVTSEQTDFERPREANFTTVCNFQAIIPGQPLLRRNNWIELNTHLVQISEQTQILAREMSPWLSFGRNVTRNGGWLGSLFLCWKDSRRIVAPDPSHGMM